VDEPTITITMTERDWLMLYHLADEAICLPAIRNCPDAERECNRILEAIHDKIEDSMTKGLVCG
jgi:hypothetical protein